MADTIRLIIDWREADADMPEAQQETVTELLFREMNGFDEVERVERVADPAAPKGGMGAAWLWSILTAEVTIANLKRLGQEVQGRLPGKPISFTVKAGDRELTVENLRPEDLDATLEKLVAAAKDLAQDS
ncbi:hypothetical protein [Leptolyngbya iicbica]|uniref:Uncharacterized protein n=2 Tax=Cyanophyceae TaxID=3028117 RepID=A0A4Q7E685_9CYAN|nr:hypothetical protein [Leptolyngbya sp. LK]RZM78630.1 hypothetical protein DYY88_07445 [Leptolyngbya sp. LK]